MRAVTAALMKIWELFIADIKAKSPVGTGQSRQNFNSANLTGRDFSEENLKNANFSNAFLAGSTFKNADLTGAQFYKAEITGATFTGAIMYNATLTGCDLNALFQGHTAELMPASLKNITVTAQDIAKLSAERQQVILAYVSSQSAIMFDLNNRLSSSKSRNETTHKHLPFSWQV